MTSYMTLDWRNSSRYSKKRKRFCANGKNSFPFFLQIMLQLNHTRLHTHPTSRMHREKYTRWYYWVINAGINNFTICACAKFCRMRIANSASTWIRGSGFIVCSLWFVWDEFLRILERELRIKVMCSMQKNSSESNKFERPLRSWNIR